MLQRLACVCSRHGNEGSHLEAQRLSVQTGVESVFTSRPVFLFDIFVFLCYYENMKVTTQKWIDLARADLDAAFVQFRYGGTRGSAYQIAVFHCHQAIEKILKAHLVEQDKEVPKIHDLTRLRVLSHLQFSVAQETMIDELQPHYLLPRYPDLPFASQFSYTYNHKNTHTLLTKTKKLFVWLETMLVKKK